MHWSIVAVQILIVTVTLSYSFPVDLKEIDLKEIEHEDIYLVDKQRKGRFIQVNQTTFQPNDFELVRAKKSSPLNVKEVGETRLNINFLPILLTFFLILFIKF